ncbi:hypothetical protein [Fodinicola feengrottensis]|nr:hypothetical protein [Fodinicola feengrottensis]
MLPLGSLLGGALASVFGLRATLTVDGIGVALSILPLLLSPLRTMRAQNSGTDKQNQETSLGSH